MSTSVAAMYLLGVVIGIVSFLVSRGPDGRLVLFFIAFATIAVAYVTLAWITRHQPVWWHLLAQAGLFLGAAALGMSPRPRLDEMAGMLYLFVPAAIVGMILLGVIVRLLARWI